MKKAWEDIKSFVTVVMTVAFVAFTAMKYISGEQFYSVFQIVIAFYFGTQVEKMKQLKEELEKKKQTEKEDEIGGLG